MDARAVSGMTLGSPAQDHEEAVLLTVRLSALQNGSAYPQRTSTANPQAE